MYDKHTLMYENHTLFNISELKVLDAFLDLKKHYFAELTKLTKLTRPRTLRVLKKLAKQNIFRLKTEANVKYYLLVKSPLVYSALSAVEYNRALFFLEKHKTLKRAWEMFKEKYKDYSAAVVFGSVVKGYAAKYSDVDILLIKENFSEDEIKKIEDIIDLINGRTGLKFSHYLMKTGEFRQKNDLIKEIMENHIILEGGELFFRMALE